MVSYKSTKLLLGLFGIIIIIFIIILASQSFEWLKYNWTLFIEFLILLVIVVLVLELIYKKYFFKNRMELTTISQKPETNVIQAKFVLKEKNEFLIKEFERNFGREDFVGLVMADDLKFIGKEHFKIIKKSDGYYIEDLITKNGTEINSMEIGGKGEVKLENEDQILVAKTIEIRYVEY